jgi:hypothetical protein
MSKDEKARAAFDSMIRIEVGDGKQVLFWVDRWIKGRTATDIAPGITMYVLQRARNERTVEQAMQNNRWMLDIQGCVATLGARECIRLWAAVNAIRHNYNTPDNFTLPWTASGAYTAASAYHMFM